MSKYIIEKIKKKQITICIIGLGYVGLPLAFRFLDEKIKVIGIDNDSEKLKKIKDGTSYIENKKFKKNNFYKKFQSSASPNYSEAKKADIIILCLPTPLNKANNPDMSLLKNCVKKLCKFLRQNQSLVLESTVYPGATLELFKVIHKKKDFYWVKIFI
tara:strand:- start:315 stop:788 length:474 start_codon:yes stop_codon:yes gene_type:complete